ncbi:iron reductase [Mycena leptocephala]|nr:iron reductase [Mycena leptocephala]
MTGSVLQSVDPDRIPRIALTNLYPKQVWYFLATFIALVTVCNFVSKFNAYLARQYAHRGTATASVSARRISWRRLPLALLNLWRIVAFRWSLTFNLAGAGVYTFSVADFLVAGMYITVLFTWTFINTTNLEGVKYDPKYWANRCTHIAASQLPLVTALGMRNNFISLLTGVSFDKLERMHRISARVICVMLWVHGSGRLSLPLDHEGTYWLRIGATGVSSLTLLSLLSIRPLRSCNYEAFKYAHTVLGVLALSCAYRHAAEFGYGVYIWPAFFLWGLDRTIRLLRIVLVNSQLFTSITQTTGHMKSRRQIPTEATVSVFSPYFLRILVDTPPYLTCRPGQSIYLTIVGAYPMSVTEAHPFTVANTPLDGALITDDAQSHSKPRLMFIVRVREGFTKRLLDSILAAPDSTGVSRSFKLFVDGPYGSPPVLRGFESVLFIAGGSGVSFTLPLFLDLVRAACATPNANLRCTRIVFVWAIRDPNQINWIADSVSRALLGLRSQSASDSETRVLEVDIRLHITAAPEDSQSLSSSVSVDPVEGGGIEKQYRKPKQRLLDLYIPGVQVQLIFRRPDARGIVQEEIELRSGRGGAVSINVCGTTELLQTVRCSLSNGAERFMDVLRGGPSVVLHIEGFGGA